MILSHRIDITPTEVTQSTQFSVDGKFEFSAVLPEKFFLDESQQNIVLDTPVDLTGKLEGLVLSAPHLESQLSVNVLDKTAEMTTKALWSDHG